MTFQRFLENLFTKFDITQGLRPGFHGKFVTALALYGAYHAARLLTVPLLGLWKHAIRPRRDLVARYGGNWALVTGASDGIGEQYAYELAKSGFNIVIVSRTLEKMEAVAKNLREQYKVQVKLV